VVGNPIGANTHPLCRIIDTDVHCFGADEGAPVRRGILSCRILRAISGQEVTLGLLIVRQGNLWGGTNTQGIYKTHGIDVDHFGSADRVA